MDTLSMCQMCTSSIYVPEKSTGKKKNLVRQGGVKRCGNMSMVKERGKCLYLL